MKTQAIIQRSVAVTGTFLVGFSAAFAQANPILTTNGGRSLGGLVGGLVGIMDRLVGILVAASLLVFFWGLAKHVYAAGDGGEHLKGRQMMLWGIIIFFVMGSLWGILQFMSNSVFSL